MFRLIFDSQYNAFSFPSDCGLRLLDASRSVKTDLDFETLSKELAKLSFEAGELRYSIPEELARKSGLFVRSIGKDHREAPGNLPGMGSPFPGDPLASHPGIFRRDRKASGTTLSDPLLPGLRIPGRERIRPDG